MRERERGAGAKVSGAVQGVFIYGVVKSILAHESWSLNITQRISHGISCSSDLGHAGYRA